MYPYFKKKNDEIQLHTTAQEDFAAGDRLRAFLEKNPSYGTLLFQVTGGQSAFPIKAANIVISKDLDETHTFSINTTTDESGKTEELALPAPNKSLSQHPGGGDVFSTYRARVTSPGYITVEILDIPIFDGITTIQPVNLSPDLNHNASPNVEQIKDEEPDL